tara:strand:+ start:5521 stop:5742 length:222 start_codon:yes stop_codon:yes gene_type:complete
MTKEEYNDVPVSYCTKCISLKVITLTGMDNLKFDTPEHYCSNCGNAEIGETHIENFKLKYQKFYGKDHLTGDR